MLLLPRPPPTHPLAGLLSATLYTDAGLRICPHLGAREQDPQPGTEKNVMMDYKFPDY